MTPEAVSGFLFFTIVIPISVVLLRLDSKRYPKVHFDKLSLQIQHASTSGKPFAIHWPTEDIPVSQIHRLSINIDNDGILKHLVIDHTNGRNVLNPSNNCNLAEVVHFLRKKNPKIIVKYFNV